MLREKFEDKHMTDTEQRLQRIARTFADVNRTYFEGVIPTPTFIINKRMTCTAGQVCYRSWTMEISPAYHDHYGWEDELDDTVKHETVHLYLVHMWRPGGHTKEFKAICERVGASLYSKPMPRRRPRYRYLVQCPQCRAQHWRGIWTRTVACRACCAAYNEGRFTPRFAFLLVTREIVPLTTS
jgi:predicted SprT family Zn-dependent metalloprotease